LRSGTVAEAPYSRIVTPKRCVSHPYHSGKLELKTCIEQSIAARPYGFVVKITLSGPL